MPRTTAKKDQLEQRRTAVATMLRAGYKQREIAAELGAGLATINADIKVLRERWRLSQTEDTVAAMLLDLERLDDLIRVLSLAAKRGHLGSIDRVIAIIRERGSIIGYREAQKLEVTGQDGGAIEVNLDHARSRLAAKLADLAARRRARQPDSEPE